MKSVTVREFYHNAGLVDGLSEGRQLVVTAKGKPKESQDKPTKLPPLVTVRGGGLTDEFKSASWNRVRHEIDRRHGA